jgi:hypothetical protein
VEMEKASDVFMAGNLRWIIMVNVILSLLYVFSNVVLWSIVNSWIFFNFASEWSPIFIMYHYLPGGILPPVAHSVYPLFNLPFWIFWVAIGVNLYFYLKLQRSRETKQTP